MLYVRKIRQLLPALHACYTAVPVRAIRALCACAKNGYNRKRLKRARFTGHASEYVPRAAFALLGYAYNRDTCRNRFVKRNTRTFNLDDKVSLIVSCYTNVRSFHKSQILKKMQQLWLCRFNRTHLNTLT